MITEGWSGVVCPAGCAAAAVIKGKAFSTEVEERHFALDHRAARARAAAPARRR
ncbi:hypothetical protein ACQEVB_35835 [Pseudonocardia sp. CA-107938]|uniref:hypothetical protein n=1 Tax=Pseudonocardia sp. CA-107938 TaxID=3240021 RepID=UPI003D8BE7BC